MLTVRDEWRETSLRCLLAFFLELNHTRCQERGYGGMSSCRIGCVSVFGERRRAPTFAVDDGGGSSTPPGAGAERAAPQEKDLIHKLFKVLAPRFQPHPGSYTRLLQIPNRDGLDRAKMAVIELKGNPFPPLIRPRRDTEKTLLNQLLKGYREGVQRAADPRAPEVDLASC
ncbi:PREDICTED: 39S ribosomal protein L17, mitochondrial [Nipponia nippon]|uniref:39S ribosomal protein L17, mitochondrial n=1 Tax=Nipponia nippon TaxID=128390 RepID=UPI0005114E15|nr:PREDICTED: 39S ribosomal protein L17, mitochondrial [Nipponia nippon]